MQKNAVKLTLAHYKVHVFLKIFTASLVEKAHINVIVILLLRRLFCQNAQV